MIGRRNRIYLLLTLAAILGCQACHSALATRRAAPPETGSQPKASSPAPNADPSQTPSLTPSPTLTLSPRPRVTSTLPPSLTPTRLSGATQIASRDGMILRYVPAGEFLMGSTANEAGADSDEIPQHTVFLDSFWIDQTEVTNAMFAAFLNAQGNQVEGNAPWLDAGDEDALLVQIGGIWQPKAGFEAFPVIEVSWYGARAYCQWAGRSLPSEAQWEKAARGSNGQTYPWGPEIACDKAQVANCTGRLHAVGSKPAGASPYGALDMAGNVWEWVADWYDPAYYASSSAQNPGGPEAGETRVLRGGAWEYDWKHARAANRRHNGPAASLHEYGFRCALAVAP